MHLFLQYSVRYIAGSASSGASNTSRAKRSMTCCWSLCLLYEVHAIELDLQSRLHQVVYFLITHWLNYLRNDYFSSKYCSQCFKVLLRQDVIHFFRATERFLGAWWRQKQTFLQRRMNPHDHITCLFLMFCIHFIALGINFTPHFVFSRKFHGWR